MGDEAEHREMLRLMLYLVLDLQSTNVALLTALGEAAPEVLEAYREHERDPYGATLAVGLRALTARLREVGESATRPMGTVAAAMEYVQSIASDHAAEQRRSHQEPQEPRPHLRLVKPGDGKE